MKGMHDTKKNFLYVIDDEFRIIYCNEDFSKVFPEFEYGKLCYKVICQEEKQCSKCPLLEENHGQSIVYDRLHKKWINVSAADIEWPGAGKCHALVCEGIKENNSAFYYDVMGKSDYDELLELNYFQDTYTIVYHGNREGHSEVKQNGKISTMVRRIGEMLIYPEDRQRFYDLWQINKIGMEGIPEEVLTPRHSEFRKLCPDGSYKWVQQILMPMKKSSKDEVFVNSIYNVIDMQAEEQVEKNTKATGTNRKNLFFRHIEELRQKSANGQNWCILAVDIEKLKLFNEWYGKNAGDNLLAAVFSCLDKAASDFGGEMGYFDNDDFALMIPYDREAIDKLYLNISELIKEHSGKIHVLPAFGIYEIKEINVPAFKAYDRANLACTEVKGNYIERIKVFDDSMMETLESEYLLFADIKEAFRNQEFSFVLQPKCNMQNGKIVGAEALARWNNKDRGPISPGVFIPFLEKNGFVSELDGFIWEEVCKWQRAMLDSHRKTVPVSVNVSRADLYSMDVPGVFNSLIEKYQLDSSLIKIEITESAYSEDAAIIGEVVSKLRQDGFCVLMDDFGSAYSSLNMLKDIEVDILKIDMRFLSFKGENASRGFDILQTVCSMAQVLGLSIIAEGVETEIQRDNLLKAGCKYAQGYYYFKPLSVEEFEKVIENPEATEEFETYNTQDEFFNIKDLLNKNMLSQRMLSNMLGAVAFYDVCDDQISIIRFNELYAELLGGTASSLEKHMHFGEQLYEEEHLKVMNMFDDAQRHRNIGAGTDIRRRRTDGTDMWLRLRVFFLYERDGHAVYYSTVDDVTEIHRTNIILEFLNNDMPGGYYRNLNTADCEFTHISKRFLEIFGYTREEIKELFDDKFINMVHPEDVEKVRRSLASMKLTDGNYSLRCRMLAKDGYISVIDQSRLVKFGSQEFFQGIILTNLDFCSQI